MEACEIYVPSEYGGFTKLVDFNLYREAPFAMVGIEFKGGGNTVQLKFVHKAEANVEGGSLKASVRECFNYSSFIEPSPSSASSTVEVKVSGGVFVKALIPNLNVKAEGVLAGNFEGVESYPDVFAVYKQGFPEQPYLKVTKVVDKASWQEGDLVTVTIHLTNLGESSALNVKVDDSESLQEIGEIARVYEGNLTAVFSEIKPGKIVEFSYIISVESLGDGGTLTLKPAKASYTDESLLNLYEASSNSLIIGLGSTVASIIPILEVNPYNVAGGETVEAQLTLANIGDTEASSIGILAKTEGGWISQEVENLPPASTTTIKFSVPFYGVQPSYDLGENLTVTFFSGETSMGRLSPLEVKPNTAKVYFSSQNVPWLKIGKAVDKETAATGETINVKLSFTALDLLPEAGLQIYEALPTGLSYVEGDLKPISGLPFILKGSLTLETLGTPKTLTYKVKVEQPEVFIHPPTLALLSFSEAGSPLIFYAENAPATSAALSLNKAFQLNPQEGVIEVTVTALNSGSQPISKLEIVDSLPEGLELKAGSLKGSIEALNPGGDLTVTYQVAVSKLEKFRLPPATATYKLLSLSFSQQSNPVDVSLAPPKVTVQKILAENPIQKEPLDITVKVRNEGTLPIFNLKLSDSLPEGFSLLNGQLSLEQDVLEPGGEAALTYTAEALLDGVYSLPEAQLEYSYFGFTFKAQSNPVENLMVAPKLAVEKKVKPSELEVGGKATITITVKNLGQRFEALNVSLVDLPPLYLEVVEGTTEISLPLLPPGGKHTITYTAKFNSPGNFMLPSPTLTYSFPGGFKVSLTAAEQASVKVAQPAGLLPSPLQSPLSLIFAAVVAAGAASAVIILRRRRRLKVPSEEEVEEELL
ncbi:hypothetical protein DRO53_03385 [Candidatus Bathyarchaeota archaeon]|nr:MAG: hypothetical protein DRO53_03385 [Candidatus Bathyarchaeota archaeon]